MLSVPAAPGPCMQPPTHILLLGYRQTTRALLLTAAAAQHAPICPYLLKRRRLRARLLLSGIKSVWLSAAMTQAMQASNPTHCCSIAESSSFTDASPPSLQSAPALPSAATKPLMMTLTASSRTSMISA